MSKQISGSSRPLLLNFDGARYVRASVRAVHGTSSTAAWKSSFSCGGFADFISVLNNFHKALEIFAELVAKDHTNADFQRQWATTYLLLSRFRSTTDDLTGAIDSALQGIRIDDVLVAASPTNASARNTLALLDSQLGASHAALAAKAGASKQTEHWRAAKEADQKSLDIYRDLKSKGTLSGANANKPDELDREIARCDAALKISN